MNLAFRLKMAKQKGESLVRELNIDSLPVDPFAIAANCNILVKPKGDNEAGVSGMLLRHGNDFGILYTTHISSKGHQRFSVGHELGHYFLEGHIDHVFSNGETHASRAGFVSDDPYEREADHFSAGLLMPSTLFNRTINHTKMGLASVESAASLCCTSLTATAIRYAELTSDAVAVIISTGRTIDYCFLSNTMKSLPHIVFPKKNSLVPRTTATAEFNTDPTRIANAARLDADIDVMDWLDGEQSVEAVEEVIGLGNYGKTLTILTCPSLVDETYQDEDENEDAYLEKQWTPRF